MKTAVACMMLLPAINIAHAETQAWNWLSANFVPCEGVGIHGSYRVFVEATIDASDGDALVLSALSVYASSSVFVDNQVRIAGTVSVLRSGKSIKKIDLVRQPPDSIAAAPGKDESDRVYLPASDKLRIVKGDLVAVEVAVALITDSGSCSLGSSSKTHDLFK